MKNKTIEVLENLEQEVQNMREKGDTDLRSILFLIKEQKLKYENYVPFISEVEKFNNVMGKNWQNRTTPTINKKDADFIVNFIDEELQELKEAIQNKDIVEILDALIDISYVGMGCGTLAFGLKDKFLDAYQEIQNSNLSKICYTEQEAQDTIIEMSKKYGVSYYSKPINDHFVVYRSSDDKVGKSLSYFRPNLKQFFTEIEMENCKK